MQRSAPPNLALKSVLFAWRRYLPVVLSVAACGLLIAVLVALVMGTVRMAALPVSLSNGDLWVGPEAARTVDESAGLSQFRAGSLWLDPEVRKIEPWATAAYAPMGDNGNNLYAAVLAIGTAPNSVALAKVISEDLRRRLSVPGTVVMGEADARRLGLAVTSTFRLNGQSVRVIGLVEGLRAAFGIQLASSDATLRTLRIAEAANPSFYILTLRERDRIDEVKERLSLLGDQHGFRVWLPEELAESTVRVWALESGAGTLFFATAAMALCVTLLVVSQTLAAAVQGALTEYAALRAYGVPFRSVQGVVIRQSAYVGLAAFGLTAAATIVALAALRLVDVPASLTVGTAMATGACLASVMLIASLAALRRLRGADPAALLR